MKSIYLSILLFFITATFGFGQNQESYNCFKVSPGEIKIDGVFDEQCWKTAPRLTMKDMASGDDVIYYNEVRLLHDNENLYLSYRFDNPTIFGKETGRDKRYYTYKGKVSEMFVKLFLDPDGDGADVLELHFNPKGTVFDVMLSIPNVNFISVKFFSKNNMYKEEYNVEGIDVAAKVNGTLDNNDDYDKCWFIEVKLPFKSLEKFVSNGLPPHNKKTWTFSVQSRYFNAKLPSKARYLSYPKMGRVDSHNYDVYADINFSQKAPRSIKQKTVWVWSLPHKTREDIERAVIAAKDLGFNTIAWGVGDLWFEFIYFARKHGIKPYAPLVVSGDYKQQLTPEEEETSKNPKEDYQRGGEPVVYKKGEDVLHVKRPELLHPFVRQENKKRIEELIDQGFAGIGLDFIGYQNYYASFTPLAEYEFSKTFNPSLPDEKSRDAFSEKVLVDFYQELYDYAREYAAQKARKIDISCHIYPTFLPNPLYGNKCKVDYCGQTVSWFFKPHWSYDKIEKYTRFVVKQARKYHKNSIGAPFIGFDPKWENGIHAKTPERMRKELQIVKESGAEAIQIAELGYILSKPEIAKVVKEELAE